MALDPSDDPRLRRRPPPSAVAWVERVLGGARVTSMRRLRAGTSSAVHLLRIEGAPSVSPPSVSGWVVLRRFVDAEWLAREPDLAAREAQILEALGDRGLSVPRLLAVDDAGSSCDVPAVLMTRVPGHLDLAPRDVRAYVRQLADFLPALHAVGMVEGLPEYAPYFEDHGGRGPRVPGWSRRPDLWWQAAAVATGARPSGHPVLIHRDYHPGNVLWQRGRLAGVTDWVNACVGPAAVDVAHCRWNLAVLFGRDVAREFRAAYEAASGTPHPVFWDLVAVCDAAPDGMQASQWRDAGRLDLTDEVMRARVDAYVEELLAEVDG